MIEITRTLARQFRAVLRKSVPVGAGRGARWSLVLDARSDGLHIRAYQPEIIVAYHLAGSRSAEVLTLPGAAFDDFDDRTDDTVILESTEPSTVQARWSDGGVPQIKDYTSPDADKLMVPDQPKKVRTLDGSFLKAMDDTLQCTAREGIRFAVQRIQMRGNRGEIVGTDGHQLLVQGGFALPWKENVLVPAITAFGFAQLPTDGPVSVGKTDKHVCIRIGPWTFFLAIADGRFPNVDDVIPSPASVETTCRMSPEDVAFLASTISRLPGRADENAPVTVDLNGHVAIRAKATDQKRVTELILARSEVIGSPARFVTDRQFLARAAQLGFSELGIVKPSAPIVCRQDRRTFVWVPLDAKGALPPAEDADRIQSQTDEKATEAPVTERKPTAMSKNHDLTDNEPTPAPSSVNGDGHTNGANGSSSLIEEAQELTISLREAYTRAARLLSGLKRQRKQSRLVSSTLASLRQLQQIEV